MANAFNVNNLGILKRIAFKKRSKKKYFGAINLKQQRQPKKERKTLKTKQPNKGPIQNFGLKLTRFLILS
ncbi:hypothetical protein GGTG_10981 [Gaeumannomyces tritici R3-111a-1]|uniref:Uncharacterized protein n=1 Tax=Gaeumannomyces tritici (strain R3-111a-1) TaxID=644352 RepID=J3PBV9_GAET3|nr:hypothetical protein GGTG_10981 [Gaeumannomyces tritici R3-111a-1]EJT71727.1 hypothetical protein GGTG_10981 [Gaeumannomyces tritici R3-111a-1]